MTTQQEWRHLITYIFSELSRYLGNRVVDRSRDDVCRFCRRPGNRSGRGRSGSRRGHGGSRCTAPHGNKGSDRTGREGRLQQR